VADTTTTSYGAMMLAENLSTTTADYTRPRVKIAPLCKAQKAVNTKTVKFNKRAKDSAAAVTEGGGGMTASAFTPTSVSGTAGQVGVLRSPSQILTELNAAAKDELAQDAAKLLVIKLETDLALLFASATLSNSNSGLAFSVAHYMASQAKLDNNDTEGPYTFVLWNNHFAQLKAGAAASTAALFGNAAQDVMKLFDGSMQGPAGADAMFMGSKIKRTSVNTTANGGVDAVSAVLVDGSVNEQQAAIGIVWAYAIKYIIQEQAQKLTTDIAGHWGVGAALVNTDSIAKIINAI
jgi:hypothetical protein